MAGQGWTTRDVEDLMFFGILGVILGGRLGYALFYKPELYLAQPLEILKVWQGGMSFHGGLLGVLAAMALFARLRQRSFLQVTDLIAPCVPTTGQRCATWGATLSRAQCWPWSDRATTPCRPVGAGSCWRS